MNLLDEQMREDQRDLLTGWAIPFRQIGIEIARFGIDDSDILPLLLRLKRATLFTHDRGFFDRRHCHAGYCLVHLDVADTEAAEYIRRFLRHTRFDTWEKRHGLIVRARPAEFHFWELRSHRLRKVLWPSA